MATHGNGKKKGDDRPQGGRPHAAGLRRYPDPSRGPSDSAPVGAAGPGPYEARVADEHRAVAEVAAGLGDAHRVQRRAEGALGKKRDRLLLRHGRAPVLCLFLLSNRTTPARFRKDPGGVGAWLLEYERLLRAAPP